jgi:hypothetical protein
MLTKYIMVPNSERDGVKEYDRTDYIENILPKFLKHTEADEVGRLINPEVPVTLIYGAHLRTK